MEQFLSASIVLEWRQISQICLKACNKAKLFPPGVIEVFWILNWIEIAYGTNQLGLSTPHAMHKQLLNYYWKGNLTKVANNWK